MYDGNAGGQIRPTEEPGLHAVDPDEQCVEPTRDRPEVVAGSDSPESQTIGGETPQRGNGKQQGVGVGHAFGLEPGGGDDLLEVGAPVASAMFEGFVVLAPE